MVVTAVMPLPPCGRRTQPASPARFAPAAATNGIGTKLSCALPSWRMVTSASPETPRVESMGGVGEGILGGGDEQFARLLTEGVPARAQPLAVGPLL